MGSWRMSDEEAKAWAAKYPDLKRDLFLDEPAPSPASPTLRDRIPQDVQRQAATALGCGAATLWVMGIAFGLIVGVTLLFTAPFIFIPAALIAAFLLRGKR